MSGEATDRVVDRRVLVKGKKFDFEEVTLAGPDGRRLSRQMVRHPGAVVVLPLLYDQIVFVRNERFAVGRTLVELPAGTLEKGEDPAECAVRELEEETGYRAATVEPLGRFLTTPGMTDEMMHAFIARDLTHVGQKLEEDERIEVAPRSVARAFAALDAGEFDDAKTILTLLLAQRRGVFG